MKLLKTSKPEHAVLVSLRPTEARALRAALAEICFGLVIDNFSDVIGCPESQARLLFSKLDDLDLESEHVLAVERHDLDTLKNAQAVVLDRLGSAEYETRTGVNFADGQVLLRQLDRISWPEKPGAESGESGTA